MIIQSLDPKDPEELNTLRRCSSASKILCCPAQTEIFRSIQILAYFDDERRQRLWACLTRILNGSSHLASYIRSMDLPAVVLITAASVQLLNTMTGLLSLKLTGWPLDSVVNADAVHQTLPATVFSRLVALDVSGISGVPISWFEMCSNLESLSCNTGLVARTDIQSSVTTSRLTSLTLTMSVSLLVTPHPLLQFITAHRCPLVFIIVHRSYDTRDLVHLDLGRDIVRASRLTLRHLFIACCELLCVLTQRLHQLNA